MPKAQNKAHLRSLLKKAETRRIDIVGIHNSEGLQGGHGFDTAIQENLGIGRYGIYGSAVHALFEGKGVGSGVGYWDATNATKQVSHLSNSGLNTLYKDQVTTAPASQLQYMNWSSAPTADVNPLWPLHVPTGSSTNQHIGLKIGSNSPVPSQEQLDFVFWGVNWGASGGSFTPNLRRGESPFNNIADLPTQTYNGTNGTLKTTSYTLAANPARTGTSIEFRTVKFGFPTTPVTMFGPLFMTYIRAMRTAKTNGIAMSALYSFGGRSAYDMYMCLSAWPTASWYHFFDALTYNQSVEDPADHVAIFDIYEGSNQAQESGIAAGVPVAGDADHPLNYSWYLRQIVNMIDMHWENSGRNPENIGFRVSCSHPLNDVGLESEMYSYRTALAAEFANDERVCVVDYSQLTTVAEMISEGDFADTIHLTRDGYVRIDNLAWQEILTEDYTYSSGLFSGAMSLLIDDIS